MGWSAFGPTLPTFSERTSFKDGSRPLSPSSPISHYLVGRREESAHLYPRAAIISISPWLMPRMGTRGREGVDERERSKNARIAPRPCPSVRLAHSIRGSDCANDPRHDDEAAFRRRPNGSISVRSPSVIDGQRSRGADGGRREGGRLAQTVRNFKAAR